MCWNASVSLNTFLLGLFAVELGIFNGVVPITSAIFYMSFISMQLVEFFLWKNLNNKKANEFWSKVGLALILVQPIAALMCIGVKNPVTWGMIIAYLVFLSYVLLVVKPFSKVDFSSEKAPNGHLRWNWLQYPIWALAIWVGFLYFHELYKKEWLLALFNFALVGLIFFTYLQSGTWGSLWCWIANVISLYILWRVFAKDLCGYIKN